MWVTQQNNNPKNNGNIDKQESCVDADTARHISDSLLEINGCVIHQGTMQRIHSSLCYSKLLVILMVKC